MRVAAHPGLYEPEVDPPKLHCNTCEACGATFFPPIGIGCEMCGARVESLRRVDLDATGTIHSVATVHVHRGNDIAAPFTIAEIVLDGGPFIRGTMTEVVGPDQIGSRCAAELVVARVDGDDEIVEPRFKVVGA